MQHCQVADDPTVIIIMTFQWTHCNDYRHEEFCDDEVQLVQKLKSFDQYPMNSTIITQESLSKFLGAERLEKLGVKQQMPCAKCNRKRCIHLLQKTTRMPNCLVVSLDARYANLIPDSRKVIIEKLVLICMTCVVHDIHQSCMM